jgi:hypothetical protein
MYNVNWVLGDSNTADFPSAHALASTISTLTYAVLAPGYYQQLLQGQAQFAFDLNVYAAHYPTDVIGGRILGIYIVGMTVSGDPLYPQGTATPGNLAPLSQAMQSYLGGSSSSPYAAACVGNVAACVANGTIPSAASYARQNQDYIGYLTYGLPPVGDTGLPAIVPTGAASLHLHSLRESGGAPVESIGSAALGSPETTLAVGAQRSLAISETVQLTVKGAWVGHMSSPTIRRSSRRALPT